MIKKSVPPENSDTRLFVRVANFVSEKRGHVFKDKYNA
jgi:hypothetical protein